MSPDSGINVGIKNKKNYRECTNLQKLNSALINDVEELQKE